MTLEELEAALSDDNEVKSEQLETKDTNDNNRPETGTSDVGSSPIIGDDEGRTKRRRRCDSTDSCATPSRTMALEEVEAALSGDSEVVSELEKKDISDKPDSLSIPIAVTDRERTENRWQDDSTDSIEDVHQNDTDNKDDDTDGKDDINIGSASDENDNQDDTQDDNHGNRTDPIISHVDIKDISPNSSIGVDVVPWSKVEDWEPCRLGTIPGYPS